MKITNEAFEAVSAKIDKQRFAKRNYATNISGLAYWRYRLFRPFLKLKYNRFQKNHSDWPWLAPDAITALNQLLSKEMDGFEYGSGRSTMFFAKRVKQLTSIEHSKAWHSKVQNDLLKSGIENVNLLLASPEKDFEYPRFTSLQQLRLEKDEYPVKDELYDSYIKSIEGHDNDSLDFIIVDGRARLSCSLKAIPKLRVGGILVLDNSERRRYAEVHRALKEWPQINTTTGLTDTTIWLKNKPD